jgi:hypothetical protein
MDFVNLDNIDWKNPNAIELLEKNQCKINWEMQFIY